MATDTPVKVFLPGRGRTRIADAARPQRTKVRTADLREYYRRFATLPAEPTPPPRARPSLSVTIELRAISELEDAQENLMIPKCLRMLAAQAFRSVRWASWEELNARRLNLIDKEIDAKLSLTEQAELRSLQAEAEKHITLPPLSIFDAMEQCAMKEGLLSHKAGND